MLRSRGVQKNKHTGAYAEKTWRIYLLVFFIFSMFFVLGIRLYFLQVVSHAAYSEMADGQHLAKGEIAAERGEIFLKEQDGLYPVAINQELKTVYAVPREITDLDFVAKSVAPLISLDEKEVREKLGDGRGLFKILKKKLSDEETEKIRNAKLEGIYLSGEKFRYYPAGELASQVVGFVGSDGDKRRGMYGVEASQEDILDGKAGKVVQEKDSGGRWISVSDREFDPAQDGADLVLTIDHAVQYEVEKILKNSIERFAADSASAIVMDPKTGRILAMGSWPSFNPNDYAQTEDLSLFINPNVSTAYESGSVFKPVTMAMGLDDGKISSSSTFVDPGVVSEAGYNIKNSEGKSYGLQTMSGILENSINTGVIYIEKLLGNAKFAQYVSNFGFGEKTGVGLPGEAAGNLANLKNHKATINFFTASFGQGITTTPIQLAVAYSALANGGILVQPQIVEKILHHDGTEEDLAPKELRQVISEQAAKQTAQMLRNVVVLGHGKRADVPGYKVCGKTGTAQVAKSDGRGYEDGMNIGSFAGFAPMDDPKFVVVVKLFNPKNVEWAESSAAPTFGEIMKFLLEYYKIKPTEDPANSPLAKMPPIQLPADLEKQKVDNKTQTGENKESGEEG